MSSKTTRISSEYTQASQTTRQTDGAGSPLSWEKKILVRGVPRIFMVSTFLLIFLINCKGALNVPRGRPWIGKVPSLKWKLKEQQLKIEILKQLQSDIYIKYPQITKNYTQFITTELKNFHCTIS